MTSETGYPNLGVRFTRFTSLEKTGIVEVSKAKPMSFYTSPHTGKNLGESPDVIRKIELVFNHIQNVQRNCYRLGLKLMSQGELELGRNLIANGQIHDNSKFKGIEFDHLFYSDPLLPEVVKHHQSINPHHPEYWGGILNMPRVYVAEMVCDWYARSTEFGTGIREWIESKAPEKFNFTKEGKVYAEIQEMLSLLLDQSFS